MKEQETISNNLKPFDPFKGPKIERVIYTTPSQSEIWIACKIGGDDANRAYNESVTLVFNGNLNKENLFEALEILIHRHQALRSVFSTDGRYMTIFEDILIAPFYIDISDWDALEKTQYAQDYLKSEANHVFDLNEGPLFKVGLIKYLDSEHHFVITAHHIICDGWSTGIILEELGSIYSSLESNRTLDLPKVNPFSDYVDHQYLFSTSNEHKNIEQYWINQYMDKVPQVSLPTDYPRPELRTYKSERLDFEMNSDLVKRLKSVGAKVGSSFVTTLMAAFEVFIYTKTGQEDLVLGLPSAGQASSGYTQLIGHCVNLLPVRSKVDLNQTLNEYLVTRKAGLFDAYDHQQLTFGELLQKLKIARDPSRVPLVPVIFNIDIGMSDQVAFKGLDYQLKSNPRAYEAFEIFLNATGSGSELTLEWSYNTSLFKRETISRMMQDFEDVILNLIEHPDRQLKTILKSDKSQYELLNDTNIEYPKKPLHTLILDSANKFSNDLAIKFEDQEINYEQLIVQVNQLANRLSHQGLMKGQVVGVCLPRSIDMVATLIAVMQCGAIYLPLDPHFPESRVKFMLTDSKAEFLITSKDLKNFEDDNLQTLFIEDLCSNLDQESKSKVITDVNSNDVVYILYTSGSTGKPKGVQITHKNLVNFLTSMAKEPGIEPHDRLLAITTISFDIVGLELYLPLLAGATLVLANDDTAKDSRLLLELIDKESITMMQATPTTWQMMVNANWEKPLKIKALSGGENLPIALAKNILTKVDQLWNMYGPTETTIWSSIKQISSNDAKITVGKPIANTSIFILNEQGRLLPQGSTGEICIAGDGVAKGYLHRPELNSEKFIDNPFEDNSKLYKTGDLGKLLECGDILCLGRIDQQIKLRGHRIELEEIETLTDSFEGVQASVVTVNKDNLAGYILLDEDLDHIEIDALKSFLSNLLPSYMVPNTFQIITEFPKTLNGKIDRKALLNTNRSISSSQSYSEPKTENEKLVAGIWKECLELKEIDIHSDFFEIGGHSLVAVRVMALIEERSGKRLPLSSLMLHSSIEKLAKLLGDDDNKVSWSSLVPLKTDGSKTPLYIVHGAGHNVLFFNSLAKYLDNDQPVYGIQAHGLNGIDKPYDRIEDMAKHYVNEIIKSNPEGPYTLSGYSFGGMVAFEMMRLFRELGKEVKTLVLFDTYIFPHYYFSSPLKKKIASKFYVIGKAYFGIADMFSSYDNLKKRLGILGSIFGRLLSGKRINIEQTQHSEQQDESPYAELDLIHLKAENRYQIIPQDVAIDLLVAEEDVYFKHDKKNFGWKPVALKGVNRHMIPGNHGTMFSPPFDKDVGRILQEVLDSKL